MTQHKTGPIGTIITAPNAIHNAVAYLTCCRTAHLQVAYAIDLSIIRPLMDSQETIRPLQIWVDADACPKVIKEILYRAAQRKQVKTTLVANSNLAIPRSPYLHFLLVGAGFDVADKEISRLMQPGDLVITADIPLAAEAIEQDGFALNPRGEFYTRDNVRSALSMRNFMDQLRGTGTLTGGPASFSQADRSAFANQLDRFLTRHLKEKP